MVSRLSAHSSLHLTGFPQQEKKTTRHFLCAALDATLGKKGCKQAATILLCQMLLLGDHSLVLKGRRRAKKKTQSTAEPSSTDLLQEGKFRYKVPHRHLIQNGVAHTAPLELMVLIPNQTKSHFVCLIEKTKLPFCFGLALDNMNGGTRCSLAQLKAKDINISCKVVQKKSHRKAKSRRYSSFQNSSTGANLGRANNERNYKSMIVI